MNNLKIESVTVEKNKIKFNYTLEGEWQKYLRSDKLFFAEYDIDIKNVPKSILYIPFICNILPMAWVYDLEIEVDEIDEDFYNNIEKIKRGYQDMFPALPMKGNFKVGKIIKNKQKTKGAGTLFSGGVDAFNTLFQHMDEKPVLITVWGSDVKLDNEKAWNKVKKHCVDTANSFGLINSFIKCNFREFLNYDNLSRHVYKIVHDEWWHSFQHGIGLLSQAAPIAYTLKLKNIYIASSYVPEDKGKYTCASDPTIDNHVHFASCDCIHDGYEFSRQDKIRNICNFLEENKNKKIKIRVCWESTAGENCCMCEKCTRTMLAIIAEKKNPENFGFNKKLEDIENIDKNIIKYAKYGVLYPCIQQKLKENYTLEETPKYLIPFRNLKIVPKKPNYIYFYEKVIRKINQIIKGR